MLNQILLMEKLSPNEEQTKESEVSKDETSAHPH